MLDFMNQRLLPDPASTDGPSSSISLMQIDKRNFFQNISVAIAVFFAFLFIIVSTLHGHPIEITQSDSLMLFNSTSVSVDRVGPYFLYVSLDCSFRKLRESVCFFVAVESPMEILIWNRSICPRFRAGDSGSVLLFYDRIIDRNQYKMRVQVVGNTSSFSEVYVVARRGNPAICSSLISARLLGCGCMMAVVVLVAYRFMWSRDELGVTWEQRFTGVLAVLCVVSDDPFAGIYVNRPGVFLCMFRVLVGSVFRVGVRYYIAGLFDLVGSQRRTETKVKDWWVFGFFIAMAVVDGIASVVREWDGLTSKLMESSPLTMLARYGSEFLSDAVIVLAVISAWTTLDSPDIFRLAVYTCHVSIILLISSAVSLLKISCIANEMNPILMLAEFMAHNYFVAMMTYVHWPCQDRKSYANPSSALNQMITDHIEDAEDYSTPSME
jgi:hypothetical protein